MNAPTAAESTFRPLSEAEIGELDELLAGLPEEAAPFDVSMLDGFLAGLQVLPQTPPRSAWLPLIYDGEARPEMRPPEPTARRIEALVQRRYQELAACLAAGEPFDPILLEPEDDEPAGQPDAPIELVLRVACGPWALGFANAISMFPGLEHWLEDETPEALVGILRYLPDDETGEVAEALSAVADEVPFESIEEAVDDLVLCVAHLHDTARPRVPVRRESAKVGRNDACPCGSGRKFKVCHGRDAK